MRATERERKDKCQNKCKKTIIRFRSIYFCFGNTSYSQNWKEGKKEEQINNKTIFLIYL